MPWPILLISSVRREPEINGSIRHCISDCLSRTHNNWEIAVTGVYGSVIARTCIIDDCLANAIENRIEQLVILSAGYDTRALRFSVLVMLR